jgi:hypothetical protein
MPSATMAGVVLIRRTTTGLDHVAIDGDQSGVANPALASTGYKKVAMVGLSSGCRP